jgi:hypothetical protein
MLLIVCPLVFLASFVDSIAGGGGLISMPAYLLTGIPTHTAFGCNKLSAGAGTAFAMSRFLKHGHIDLRRAMISAAFALFGALIGARVNLLIDAAVLKRLIIILIPAVAVFVLFSRRRESSGPLLQGNRLMIACALIGLLIGLYDGLIGPGTGTFLIIAFTAITRYDTITASGNAKVVNLASNLASLAIYLINGRVLLWLALPAAACGILGSWLGSHLAITRGARLIKAMLLVVLIGIMVKLVYDLQTGG